MLSEVTQLVGGTAGLRMQAGWLAPEITSSLDDTKPLEDVSFLAQKGSDSLRCRKWQLFQFWALGKMFLVEFL